MKGYQNISIDAETHARFDKIVREIGWNKRKAATVVLTAWCDSMDQNPARFLTDWLKKDIHDSKGKK